MAIFIQLFDFLRSNWSALQRVFTYRVWNIATRPTLRPDRVSRIYPMYSGQSRACPRASREQVQRACSLVYGSFEPSPKPNTPNASFPHLGLYFSPWTSTCISLALYGLSKRTLRNVYRTLYVYDQLVLLLLTNCKSSDTSNGKDDSN